MTVELKVFGLRCSGCANKLEHKLNEIEGITASVSFALEQVVLDFSTDATQLLEQAIALILGNGYQLAEQQLKFQVSGWSCAGCANKTITALKQLPGIKEANSNAATDTLTVSFYVGAVKPAQFAIQAQALGYQLLLDTDNEHDPAAALEERNRQNNASEKKQLIVSCLFTLPLIVPMVMMLLGVQFHLNPWLELVLASVVQFFVGYKFYRGAWMVLKNGSSNMDTLVVLGTSAAYIFSCYLLFTLGDGAAGLLYFEASAVVITFISIGKWLERRAKFSTGQVIRELMALRPVEARVLRGEQELMLPLEQLLVGDTVRVLAGEKIPADGEIIDGESEADESLVTGESLPVLKQCGDVVIAGSVNGHGVLLIEVNAVAENSSINQIIKLVESAQMQKAPIERLVDKISSIFVPLVIVIAVATFFGWLALGQGFEVALINSVAVLVVACPCALGLATPATVVVGSGVAARHGIIIRDPKALEIASRLEIVAFDKTGTLTIGKPRIKKLEAIGDFDHAIFSSLMLLSEHPLARAVVEYGQLHNYPSYSIEQFKVHAGKGVTGQYQGQSLIAGNLELMKQQGVQGLATNQPSKYSEIYFSIDLQLCAIAYLEDALRETSHQAINALKARGVEVAMLSGDHLAAAQSIAGQLNLDNVHAQLKPQDKLAVLKAWQAQGKSVAMVGDGINDAPALAQADLGIAMGSGTQVAIASADITLIRDNPLLVSAAISIAQATWVKIKQNLFLAFVFNALAIPLAAAGFLSPQLAGLAMALSSVTVLSNALLLKRWKNK
ncbi:MAG: cadmium-translocating P-type ATPase [Gammaproteobacteria bacterium]|nr:cadmium-translocating P-type ATPase [Gammaproteobacteria bacterium]